MISKFTLEVPNDLLEVVVEIFNGNDDVYIMKRLGANVNQYVKAKAIVRDFIDQVESMTRKTADNHMPFLPHGNSINREE